MTKELEDKHNGGYSFSSDGIRWFMIRCHECQKENYASAVATGQCAWCGFDCNAKKI